MTDQILIRVKPEFSDYDNGYVNLHHDEVTVEQLFQEHAARLSTNGYIIVAPKDGKIDKTAAKILRNYGWVHLETAKNREERKVMEQEYFLVDTPNEGYFIRLSFNQINDMEELTFSQLDAIAKGAKIVQVVNPKTVLTTSDQKKLRDMKKKLEVKKDKAKLLKEKKSAKMKERQIANAKKILAKYTEMTAS